MEHYSNDIKNWCTVRVYGLDFRPHLLDMARTTTRLNLWEWFKNEDPPEGNGYMFWGHPNVGKISDGLDNNDHSGATFGYCMRQIQFIAKNGFESWNVTMRNANESATNESAANKDSVKKKDANQPS
tara:strand:- start:582 stop:962 length:381 start_codon:yes stop_codon:yes gene_type:complete